MKIIVASLVYDNDIIKQHIFFKSKIATETMIEWAKQTCLTSDISLKDFMKIENEIRADCYYGSSKKKSYDVGIYTIWYTEHEEVFHYYDY